LSWLLSDRPAEAVAQTRYSKSWIPAGVSRRACPERLIDANANAMSAMQSYSERLGNLGIFHHWPNVDPHPVALG
jgi:hypothetical protein